MRSELLAEEYFRRVDQILKYYHRKEYFEAQQRLAAVLLSIQAEPQLQPPQRTRLELELTSLRGLLYFTTLQYEAAEADFQSCRALDKYHLPTSMRRLSLFLRRRRFQQALEEMRQAYRVYPEGKYRGYELEMLQEQLEEVRGERGYLLKRDLHDLLCQQFFEDEAKGLDFMNLRMIEKKTKAKSARKTVDFGETKQIEISREPTQLFAFPQPLYDIDDLLRENEELKAYIEELQFDRQTERYFLFDSPGTTRSILKASSIKSEANRQDSVSSLFSFSIQKVRDIEGKPIRKSRSLKALRLGESKVQEDGLKEYRPYLKPIKSLIKLNGSFCAQKYISSMRERGLFRTAHRQRRLEKVRDIEGPVRVGVYMAVSSNKEQQLTVVVTEEVFDDQPKHEYDVSRAAPTASCIRDPDRRTKRRGSIVCFKE